MGIERNIDPNAQPGLRIKLVKMHDDPRPIDEDLEGTISHVDSLGTIHVNWDDGRFLGVVPNVDEYILYPPSDQVIDDLDSVLETDASIINNSMPKPTLRGAKSTPAGKAVNKSFKTNFSKTNPKTRDIKVEDEVKGGEADKLSVKDLAKKHNVSVDDIKKELKIGNKIEMEHTDDKKLAREIAMDHIAEFPDYYSNPKHGTIASEKGLEKVHEAFFGFGKKKDKDDQFDNMKMTREIKTIAKAIETMKPGQDTSIKNMIENFRKKYAEHSLVDEIMKSFYHELDSKFDDIEETTMAGGGASTGAFSGPLNGPVKRKGIYEPKNENRIIKAKDLLSEINNTQSTRLRDGGGTYDGNAWVGDKKDDGWDFNDETAWEGGEIVDILAKLDINWTDGNLTVDTIKEAVSKHNLKEGWLKKTHEDKLTLSVLMRVKEEFPSDAEYISFRYGHGGYISFTLPGVRGITRIQVSRSYSIGALRDSYRMEVGGRELPASRWAMKKLFKYVYNIVEEREDAEDLRNIEADLIDQDFAEDVFNMDESKKHDNIDEEEELDETTTFGSVWGGDGPPVTPTFAASGKHIPSKKPMFKGGTIVQKIKGGGVMTEVNTVKYVKDGKFVKIKDKCAKYRNNEHCSEGAIDDPLELSDTTFKNVQEVAKKMGLTEDDIINRLKKKLKGVSKEQRAYNLKHGLPMEWKGSKEGFYEYMENRKNYSGSN